MHARRGSDEFAAGVVSFGLFGVIVSVTLSLGPKYMIAGHEQNVAFEVRGSQCEQCVCFLSLWLALPLLFHGLLGGTGATELHMACPSTAHAQWLHPFESLRH